MQDLTVGSKLEIVWELGREKEVKILFGAEGSGGRRRELSRVVIPQNRENRGLKKVAICTPNNLKEATELRIVHCAWSFVLRLLHQ